MTDTAALDIVHHEIPGRFVAEVDGHVGYLDYEMDDGVMHITHTIVPKEIGGRGVASQLVATAFRHARDEGWKVRTLCQYAAAWADRHPAESAGLRTA
jgi:predicted GNAT family acetyltransferase